MASVFGEKLNIQSTNYIPENRTKINSIKKEPLSISVNSQKTNDKSTNCIQGFSRKISTKKFYRSLSVNILSLNKKSLFIEQEFTIKKDDSEYVLIFKKNTEKNKNVNNMKQNNVRKDEENLKTIVYKKSENINNSVYCKELSDEKKNHLFNQIYIKNYFCINPPKVSDLFLHDFIYENKSISSINDTYGDLNENKKIPHIFYRHLLLNTKPNKKTNYLKLSTNQRFHGKVLTLLYYKPKKNL